MCDNLFDNLFIIFFGFGLFIIMKEYYEYNKKEIDISSIDYPTNEFFYEVKKSLTKTVIVFSEEFDKDYWYGLKDKDWRISIKMIGEFQFTIGCYSNDPRDPHELNDETSYWSEVKGCGQFNITIVHWKIEESPYPGYYTTFECYMYISRYTRRTLRIKKMIELIEMYSKSVYKTKVVYFEKMEFNEEFVNNFKSVSKL